MRYGFVKDHLPPNRYASRAEFFQVLIDFIGRFTQLKAGMPKALLSFISHPLGFLLLVKPILLKTVMVQFIVD
jgi:hypothetical protein